MPSETLTRRVKFFRNGRNQAVRIPREFEVAAPEGVMWREGDRLILEPAARESLLAYLETMEPVTEDIGPIEDLPLDAVEL